MNLYEHGQMIVLPLSPTGLSVGLHYFSEHFPCKIFGLTETHDQVQLYIIIDPKDSKDFRKFVEQVQTHHPQAFPKTE
jgi:hypothetical protein